MVIPVKIRSPMDSDLSKPQSTIDRDDANPQAVVVSTNTVVHVPISDTPSPFSPSLFLICVKQWTPHWHDDRDLDEPRCLVQ
jgi:hypothetical protein